MKIKATVNGRGGELCSVVIDVGDLELSLSQLNDEMREENGFDITISPGDTIVITEVK